MACRCYASRNSRGKIASGKPLNKERVKTHLAFTASWTALRSWYCVASLQERASVFATAAFAAISSHPRKLGSVMAETTLPFHGARVKITRAMLHIEELEQTLKPYVDEGPLTIHEFAVWQNRDDRTWGFSIRTEAKPPPEMTAAILGDIIHNLRSSLDLIASELAEARGKRSDDVYFPFSGSAEDLDLMIKRRRFDRCGEDAVDLLKTLQPFVGGNLLLRAIHDLDIVDKHRSLVPVPDPNWAVDFPIAGKTGQGKLELGMPTLAAVVLAFPPGGPLENEPLFVTLNKMVALCESIVEAFAMLPPFSEVGVT